MADETAVAEAPKKKKKRRAATNDQPGGQTAEGSGELGGVSEDEFPKPFTRLTSLGQASDTEVEDKSKTKKAPAFVGSVAQALGLKKSNVRGYNERTKIVVFDNGGKYQLSKSGRALRHLAGPKPPADLELDLVDARSASPFTGTAAAINSSVHEDKTGEEALLARKRELEAELAAVNEELGEEDDSEEEE
jgi:hypothetical protein